MVDRRARLAGAAAMLASIAAFPTTSLADGPVFSLLVGGINTEDVEAGDVDVEFDTGFAFAGQFGYQFDIFRLAGEFGYQVFEGTSDADINSELGISRFTLNGYVDLPIAPRVGPYVGGGFGVANVRTGDDLSDDFEDEDTAFTWHAEAGLNIGLNDNFSLAPTYRYQWIDTDIGGQTEALKSHIFGVALKFQFGSRRTSDDYVDPPRDRYDSGYTSYGSGYRYDRFDHYDDYHHRHRYRDRYREKRPKTPEERERDKCGWEGPGCDDDNDG